MQHRTIEKSVALTGTRIVLGHEGATLPVDAAGHVNPSGLAQPLPAQPSPAERIADLERANAAALARIAHLEPALAAAEKAAQASADRVAELEAGFTEMQEAAEKRGRADGREAALADSQAELQKMAAALEAGLAKLAENHAASCAQLLANAADIALAATAKVIGERSTDAAQVGAAVEYLIAASGLAGALKVALAPSHLELLGRDCGELVQRLHARGIELRADSRIAYGGLLLEAADATVDARFEVQMEKLRRIVAEFDTQGEPS
jgi:flagellar biosynthesis/type III secretory pathway protein FliH